MMMTGGWSKWHCFSPINSSTLEVTCASCADKSSSRRFRASSSRDTLAAWLREIICNGRFSSEDCKWGLSSFMFEYQTVWGLRAFLNDWSSPPRFVELAPSPDRGASPPWHLKPNKERVDDQWCYVLSDIMINHGLWCYVLNHPPFLHNNRSWWSRKMYRHNNV